MTTAIPTLRPDAQALVDAWGPLFVYNNDFCFPDYRAVCLSPPERQVGGWYAYFYDSVERARGIWEGRCGMDADLSDAIVEAWTQKNYYKEAATTSAATAADLQSRMHKLRRTIRSLKRGRGRNRVRDWRTVERLLLEPR